MRKKFFYVLMIMSVILLSSCRNNNDSLFKNEYESLNGEGTYREVNIPNDNPYIVSSSEDVLNKIDSNDTFYLYFGFAKCPWCRSVIEKSIEVAKDKGIKEIYYVDVYDMRDTYELEDGNPIRTKEGSEGYYKLLDKLSDMLPYYTLIDSNNNTIEVGEKRIYAPTFIYVKEGRAVKTTDGISDKQTDSHMELTIELLKDETDKFNEFFSN